MRCYAGRVQLAVLVLVLLLTAVHAEDRDDEPTGLSTRLRAIDESAEFEADHPERLGADPADAAAAPSRPRPPSTRARTRSDAAPAARAGSAPSAPAAPLAPSLGSTLESPIGTSPLAPSPSTDDD